MNIYGEYDSENGGCMDNSDEGVQLDCYGVADSPQVQVHLSGLTSVGECMVDNNELLSCNWN